MDYSSDLLNKIQDLSKDLTPPQEISALLDIDETELRNALNTIGSPVRKAFMKGYAETALKLRKQTLELVDTGSPAADEACRGYLKRMIRDIEI